jgi:quercetin dioxygenase-like cupin family protein
MTENLSQALDTPAPGECPLVPSPKQLQQEGATMKGRILLLSAMVCLLAANAAVGQDAAKVDPKHYKVESENAQVRILRVHYGPHEKSVMHSHPDAVAIYLSNGTMVFHFPDGKTQNATGKSGQSLFTPAVVHDPENTGDKPFDAIVIELKNTAGGANASKK